MIDLTKRRLVIAHNPLSSRAIQVDEQVFARLDAAGYKYHKIEVQKASLEANVKRLKSKIKPGDIVISAGGDGSAHAIMHTVIAANKPGVSVGFLAYGNFNDMAHSLNKRAARQDPVKLLEKSTEQKLYPLSLYADDKLERHALLYATIGWTAKAAGKFDDMSLRKELVRTGNVNLVGSLWHAFKYYMQSRAHSDLVDFTARRQKYSQRTDILLANSTALARLFKTGKNYGHGKKFLFRTLRVRWLLPNIGFLTLGLVSRIRGQAINNLSIKFSQKSKLPVQCDGEVFELETDNIKVKKGDIAITVMSSR